MMTTTSSYSRSTSPANTSASISGRCVAVAAWSRSAWSSSSAFAPTDPRPSRAYRLGQEKCSASIRISYAYLQTQGISLVVVVCDKSGCLNIYFERTDDKINAYMWQVLISKLCFEQAKTQGDIFLHTIKHENERTGWTNTQRQNYLEKFNIFHTSATSTHIIENGPLALYVVRQNKKIRLSRLFAETEMSKTAQLKAEADAEKDQANDYCEYYNYYCEQLKLFSCIAKCVISP